MFDTNIFNEILDHKIDLDFDKHEYYVTHVQFDELNATNSDGRRSSLLNTFKVIGAIKIPTESAVWDVSEWDECKWPDENGYYDKIFEKLEAIKSKKNNKQDSLIGETAIVNKLLLVTNDKDLNQVVYELGGHAKFLNDFLDT